MQKVASALVVCNFEKQENCSPEMKKSMEEIKAKSAEDILADMKKLDDVVQAAEDELSKFSEEQEAKQEVCLRTCVCMLHIYFVWHVCVHTYAPGDCQGQGRQDQRS